MAEPEFHLDAVQRWMQAVITHPDGVAAGLDSETARQHIDVPPEDVESVVSRSQALTSVERLSIYANAYYARLLECLGEEFPVLKQTLGEETFDAFAFGYLQKYPSRSYTLGKLGANFAQFLAETRPVEDSPEDHPAAAAHANSEEVPEASDEVEAGVKLPDEWPELLIDLATMEWTFSQVFDGKGVEGQPLLSAEQLRQIDPDAWMNARLETVCCLRLLTLRFPLNDYYTAMRRDEQPSLPAPAASWLAVTRRDYIVRRHDLSERQYVLLSALQAGQPIGEAIDAVVQQFPGIALAVFAGELGEWFRRWAAEGLFERVLLDTPIS
jgi:hypothetical protein